MVLAVLFLAVPGALAFVLLGRARLLQSSIARAFAGWFIGETCVVYAVYLFAVLLAPSTTGVLRKAAVAVLALACAALAWTTIRGRRTRSTRSTDRTSPAGITGRAVFLAACAAFAFFFYRSHLVQTPDAIVRTPIYWDLSVHAPIVQSFVHGDNFPAENESYAGAPLTYHFAFDLFTATLAAFGLSLSHAFLLTSAISLFAMLGLLLGFSEEIAGGPGAGMFAALFAATSGSLRFLDAFRPKSGWSSLTFSSLGAPFADALDRHPYLVSFVKGNPFAYNGTMFNLFYFLEERQLVFAAGFLLAAVLLLTTRARWTYSACAAAGLFLGLFVFWHLFVTVSLGLAVVWLLAFDGERRKTAVVLAGMAAVGIAFLIWVGAAMRPEWFLAGGRPALRPNPSFSTVPGGPAFSLLRAFGYWIYAWGLKAPLAVAGLALAYRGRRILFTSLASVVVPTFLLVNAVQVVPLSVYDNHKWLRPMCLFVDLAAGYALVRLVRGGPWRWIAAAALIPFLTVSGVIEGIPFFASRPTVLYARYPSQFDVDVRARTAPRDVFASFEANAVHLAGRKLFVGNDSDERGTASLVASAGFDVGARQRIVFDLYSAETPASFCRTASGRGAGIDINIDWLEIEPELRRASGADARAPGFDTITPEGRAVRFLDVSGFCRSKALTPLSKPR